MAGFKQLVSINFQGTVILFGRRAGEEGTDIWFNVLGAEVQNDTPTLRWSGFTRLEFTKQVRQVGMSIITLLRDAATMQPSPAPFRVVTDQNYIAIVQQSARGTLYVSRFHLLKTQSGTDQKTTTYSLAPAWEVRYARSGKEDVPADASDTQEYLDPNGVPFLEPALELSMVDAVKDGAFEVLLLPVAGSPGFAWQFVVPGSANDLAFFNFPATANGLFDVTGKKLGAEYRIEPDTRCTIVAEGATDALPLKGPPRAVVYVKHEKVVQPDGTSIGVKRAARVMLVQPVAQGGKTVTATIDSAVAGDGTMARMEGAVSSSAIQPAIFDLAFASGACLALDSPGGGNPLAITGPYSISFLIAPAAMFDGAYILGGTDQGDPNKAAPFVRIVDGDKLEIGFGTGDAAVACRTLHQALFTGTWSDIRIDYAGKGDNPFTVTVNGSVVPLTACSAPAEPGGTPIARIGAPANGFAGALNSVDIAVAGKSVVTLPCSSVDYEKDPPVTPNTADSGVVATVFGARNEPSSSPVNVDMSGSFHVDSRGITFYAGIADFIEPASPACLIDGSDGLLHLYYEAEDHSFSAAQFSTAAARATFYAAWSTAWSVAAAERLHAPEPLHLGRYMGWMSHELARVSSTVLAAPDNSQNGFVNFVAQRVGTYMNGTKVAVASSPVSPLLCDLTIEAPDKVGTETWRGLPRDIDLFTPIFNGAASNSPDAQGVMDGATPFFDYAASVPAVLCPSSDGSSGSYFQFVSVPRHPLKLAAVTVAQGTGAGFFDIDVEMTAPSNWQADQGLKLHLPQIPADARPALDVFAGKASRYDYAGATTPGSRAYGLALTNARSDDPQGHLLIFVRDALQDFSIAVADAAAPANCTVTICGVTLGDVPRRQEDFAAVLNGQSGSYPYPGGYKADIAPSVFALPSGLAAGVLNASGTPTQAGALAYAGLLRLLFLGASTDGAALTSIGRTEAAILQGASLTFNDRTDPIRGSMLFGAVIVDPPTDGGVGRLANTSGYSGGTAPLLMQGMNGGWMPVAPGFGLDFNSGNTANYVGFNVDKAFSPSDRLAIDGDLTLQGWIDPRPAKKGTLSRALTYNVVGNLDHPDLPIQYLMGTVRGPALVMGSSTSFTRAFNFDPPALTVQIYVKLPDSDASGTVFAVYQTMGSTEYVRLAIDEYGKAVLSFLGSGGSVTSAGPLPIGAWTCLTAVVADAGGGKATVSLYVDDGEPVSATLTNSFTGELGALTVGSTGGEGIAAAMNGVAFWQRALSADNVRDSVRFGFADNDAMLGIRWNLTEGSGTTLMNSAATGSDYDTQIVNPVAQSWDPAGAFDVAYAGRNELVLVSNRIVKGWTNVALTSRQGHGLALDGKAYGKIDDGSPFNPGASFAIEAWVAPRSTNARQVIVEKPGSYSLYINTLGQVVLKVTVSQPGPSYDAPPVVFTHEIKAAIPPGKTSYVAVNFTTGTTKDDKGDTGFAKQKYYIYSSLFIDGVRAADANKSDYTQPITVENRKSSFFLGMSGDQTFYLEGLASHVRVWSRTLGVDEIARIQQLRLTPTDRNGLTASWDFDEMTGTVARDLTGNNDLQLSSNQLWTIWQDVAQAEIFVNGGTSLPRRLQPSDVGGYDDTQFTLGGARKGSAASQRFWGETDDVRIYATRLTGQQLAEGMNKWLTGTETHLAGYWMMDAGSGTTLFDATGMGNNGTLLPASAPPLWRASTAPIQNEGQSVVNAIGGRPSHYVAAIEGPPSVIEFAAAEADAYGNVFSVMRRGYFFDAAGGGTELETGYKVGDLDTIFVGQVQSAPSIVGYVEGGPPIPSENQTLAYWYGDGGGPASAYTGISAVTYLQSESTTWTYSATQSSVFSGSFALKGGFFQKSKSEVSVGVGAEAQTEVVENEVKLGLKTSLSGEIGGSDAVAQSHTISVNYTTSMTPAGRWEPASAIRNPVVGRRYIQNNIGLALVKSATADLFMLALKGTQTPVSYVTVPNKTIPVDSNLIEFPINPKYVKNGTLDGMVGLVTDLDYPGANKERGSYFKPIEAYSLKRSIEKQEQQLKAYYDQFSVNRYRLIGSLQSVKDKLAENDSYDFAAGRNERSIFCNYVWSAGGGLHKEEHSVANSYTETYTGASSLKFTGGLEISGKIGTPFGGYFIECDIVLGNTWSMTATKAESRANGFQLLCSVRPTDFLPAPIIETGGDGQLIFKGYGDTAAPGKVDTYRFMSFLLAPASENFTALSKVVDPNWLANGTTAAANAMREALNNPTQPWRILYRTTFVGRVPASFQPVKDETNAPNITPPANLASNDWLVRVIDDQITGTNPTPLEIGTAIDTVLGPPGGTPGLLKDLIPWWAAFFAAASRYGTEDFRELAELRVDLLEYMVSKYAAENYALGTN